MSKVERVLFYPHPHLPLPSPLQDLMIGSWDGKPNIQEASLVMKGQQSFFRKDQRVNISGFAGQIGLCHNYSTVPLLLESSRRQ